MSRYILKAECATADPFVNVLESSSPVLDIKDKSQLIVFLGDKIPIQGLENQYISASVCTGGLYASQHFTWKNLNSIEGLDMTKLFIDYNDVTVTLSADLVSAPTSSTGVTPPPGALAINLGSKGFQFDSSNMTHADEWGKLVYYEQGGLGIGWAFDANTYFNRLGNNLVAGLGMYMLGGLIPDISYQIMGNNTNFTYLNSTPIYNPQISRDQALLTLMNTWSSTQSGPTGYWRVSPSNLSTTDATYGRFGGTILGGTTTTTPVFNTYSPFGFLYLGYPTATQTTEQTGTLGWNNMFPSYLPSTQDGSMPYCNALSIEPMSFFTQAGLALMNTEAANPTGSTIFWTKYWEYATNEIHLEETKSFYIDAPLFNAPISMALIPNVTNGLDLVVPITRMYNGVYMYVPIKTGTDAISPVNMNGTQVTDNNYFTNPLGTLQKWFVPKRVALTLNIPFIRIDTAIQASRFFNTVSLTSSYTTTVPVWLKFYYKPDLNPDGSTANPLSASTTATISQIGSFADDHMMEFNFTAREILTKFNTVLANHSVPVSNGWGLNSLVITKVLVSCTTTIDLPRLYATQLSLPNFTNSPQGAIISKGGIKVFSRCGHSLSNGVPTDMYVKFHDIVSETLGFINSSGVREAHCDIATFNTTRNDYFNGSSNFIFTNNVPLRIPAISDVNDSGGILVVGFKPRPVLNLPFSGEVINNPLTGGPQFANSAITDSTITATNLASYKQGWFNGLNPFCADYNSNYNYNTSPDTTDAMPYLDYKMVDFNSRKVEIWIQVQAPVQIYNGSPFM